MSFLTPAALSLAVLLPVIVAMYLLRLRRTEQVVSSVYLWRRMVRDVEANAPWQRLRRNLLLIVQLFTLAVLILALARPFTWAEGGGGKAAIVILDISASMAALDADPDRLGAAKEQALAWVDALSEDARVTVIAASDGAQVLVASSQDRRQVRQAIREAALNNLGAQSGAQSGVGSGSSSDLTAALELASAIAARQPDTEIVIYSDGRVTLPERMALKGTVRYMPVGVSGDNQAIALLSLRPMPGGGLTAFAQVINYGDAPVQRRLSLYAGDARQRVLFSAYDLDILPGQPRAVVAENLPPETQVVEARLSGEDVLALDDRAWAVHRTGAPARVTLVTEGNLFLETGLSLFPNLEVTTIRPGDWESGRGGGDQSDLPAFQPSSLTILDAYVPVTATLPSGNLLFVAPPRSTEVFSVTGRVDQPALRAMVSAGDAAGDPLLAHVDLGQVNVLEAARVSTPIWARPVIVGDTAGDSTSLLWAGERDGRRVALLAFDLRRSDLPLQVAFPVLLANLTNWLAPTGGSDLPTMVRPGAVLSLALPPGIETSGPRSVYAIRPDGSRAQLAVEGGQAILADTRQLGVYEVRWGTDGAALFAVNLFSSQESDVRPAGNLPLVGTGNRVAPEAGPERTARREWWRVLAFIALGLLVAEWMVYHRATVVRLWASLRRGPRATQGARRQT